MAKKKLWFEFYVGDYNMTQHKWYQTKVKVQKRYIDRLFKGIDEEVVTHPFNNGSTKQFTVSEILKEVQYAANKQSSLLKYFKTNYPEYLL